MVGEAPGTSEDDSGRPFVGEAGKDLDEMMTGAAFRWCVTNVVGCVPLEPIPLGTPVIRQPTKGEAEACRPRLLDMVELCEPRLIVTLGQVAAKLLPPVDPIPVLQLVHPAFITRLSGQRRVLAMKQFRLSLDRETRKWL